MDKEQFYLQELSAIEVLYALREAEELFNQDAGSGYEKNFWRGMCEYAAVLSYALYEKEGRVFTSPREVLEGLPLRQLTFWGQKYEADFPEEEAVLGSSALTAEEGKGCLL